MRPPANGSIQVSPTWSGQTSTALSRSGPAIGENTAPGIASVPERIAAGAALTLLREQCTVTVAIARIPERITRSQQARVATALVAAARFAALIGARDARQ